MAAQLRCCPDPFQKFGGTSVLSTAPPPRWAVPQVWVSDNAGSSDMGVPPLLLAALAVDTHNWGKPTPHSDISRGGGGGQAEGSEAWMMMSQDHQGQRELRGEGGRLPGEGAPLPLPLQLPGSGAGVGHAEACVPFPWCLPAVTPCDVTPPSYSLNRTQWARQGAGSRSRPLGGSPELPRKESD